jgi:predicted O-methyltransferase YrrM
MPIIPNALERLVFVTLNQAPGPMLDLFAAVAFRSVVAAIKLGVFDRLHRSQLSTAELAQQLGTDERGTRMLLQFLEALGYVQETGDRYTNTPMANKWLVQTSPTSMAPGFRYWGIILSELWGDLEDTIRTGQPRTNLYAWIETEPTTSLDFQTWMVAIARLTGGEIVRKLRLPPTARRLLDVGGGHGMYSMALCRRYPELSATVFDSPEALKAAESNIAAEKMGSRITLQPGDFLQDDLGSGYDVALLFNIVHGLSADQNRDLVHKVVAALSSGGLIVVAEQVAGKAPGRAAKASAAMLGLSYFHLLGGQIYTYDEIAGWLTDAGVSGLRRINLLKAPGTSLIIGTKG